uniref:E3 UFM1-protein ligase 1-like domain-containing protein n=1 Tax=Kalanchoe fedtschenkoi TaxID=63787 RepID=A0A7N0VFX7_KALFE
MDKIMKMVPDLNEQGMEDPESTLRPVAAYLRPKLNNLWKDRRRALFTENIEKISRMLDALQKKLDEAFLVIQLYEKALDLFEYDPPTSHLLRTAAAAIVDILLVDLDKHNRLKNGIKVEETGDLESAPLTPGDRTIAKTLPGSLLTKALTVVETLEGKVTVHPIVTIFLFEHE